MTFTEGQIEVTKAYVLYWHTMIVSGAYKNRSISRDGRYLTEPELLREALDTMKRHIHILNEHTDRLAPDVTDPE